MSGAYFFKALMKALYDRIDEVIGHCCNCRGKFSMPSLPVRVAPFKVLQVNFTLQLLLRFNPNEFFQACIMNMIFDSTVVMMFLKLVSLQMKFLMLVYFLKIVSQKINCAQFFFQPNRIPIVK